MKGKPKYGAQGQKTGSSRQKCSDPKIGAKGQRTGGKVYPDPKYGAAGQSGGKK